MLKLNQETFNDIVNLLISHCTDSTCWRDLTEHALQGCAVLKSLDYSGSSRDDVVRLVTTLQSYGECETGTPALITILEHLKTQVDIPAQQQTDELIKRIQEGSTVNESFPSYKPSRNVSTRSTIRKVFISYKSEYRKFANQVKQTIESWGHSTWFDQVDIPKGAYFRTAIQEGLEASDVVLGIVTPEAIQSREVQAEWDFAFRGSCPLLLLLHKPTSLPYHLQNIQYIDGISNQEQSLQQLQQALQTGIKPPFITTSPAQEKAVQIPTKIQADNRAALLEKVETFWIEGVLNDAIGEQKIIPIGMATAGGAVLKHRDYEDYEFPKDDLQIKQVFEDLQRELLILGAPGSGKTILLLQLAKQLLEEARNDDRKPIPVIFNLSSWASTRKSLQDWLAHEIHLKYHISKRTGKQWIEKEKLLLLLDGLDEVVNTQREKCLDAINIFREVYRGVDMVVCSRTAEYEALTNKLNVRAAISLKALVENQIQDYLADDAYDTLREKISENVTLREMAEVPFLLNTMAYAYRDANVFAINPPENQSQPEHLFGEYVEKRIRNIDSDSPYTPRQIRRYLGWLAKMMVRNGETIFAIESLEAADIDSHRRQIIFRLLLGGYIGFIFGLIAGLVSVPGDIEGLNPVLSKLGDGAGFGLGIGLFLGLDALSRPSQFKRSILAMLSVWLIYGLTGGLIFWLTTDLIAGPVDWLIEGLLVGFPMGVLIGLPVSFSFHSIHQQRTWSIRTALIYGIGFCLLIGLIVGLIVGLIDGFKSGLSFGLSFGLLFLPIFAVVGGFRSQKVAPLSYPNQGFQKALRYSILITVFVGIAELLIASGLEQTVFEEGLFQVATTFILMAWLIFGTVAVVRHMITRFILAQQGHIPRWRYDKFLDYAANTLHFLRKVGGSYIFRHRYLLEYFAGRDLDLK